MNATMLAYGHATGGNKGAIELLRYFWERVSDMGKNYPFRPTPLDKYEQSRGLDHNPFFTAMGMLSSIMSPYQFNPTNINPLRDLVNELVDFEVLKKKPTIPLFLCATNCLTCKQKTFRGENISLDAVMASACLPNLFQAVEIDGEFYWDGGYTANPPFLFFPYATGCGDVLFILVNPFIAHSVPIKPNELIDRMNIVSFNASLIKDLTFYRFLKEIGIIRGDADVPEALKPFTKLFIHAINSQDKVHRYGFSSKYNTDMDFLEELYKLGYGKANQWMKLNYGKIGVGSTLDLDEVGVSAVSDWEEDLQEAGYTVYRRMGEGEWGVKPSNPESGNKDAANKKRRKVNRDKK